MTTLSKLLAATLIVLSLGLSGCSSIQNGVERTVLNFSSQPAKITCYSGGQLIYDDQSIGKVTDDEDSDGFFWKDKEGFVEMNADCIFRYPASAPKP